MKPIPHTSSIDASFQQMLFPCQIPLTAPSLLTHLISFHIQLLKTWALFKSPQTQKCLINFSCLSPSMPLRQKRNILLIFTVYLSDCVEQHLHKPVAMLQWVLKGGFCNYQLSKNQISISN